MRDVSLLYNLETYPKKTFTCSIDLIKKYVTNAQRDNKRIMKTIKIFRNNILMGCFDFLESSYRNI